MDIRLENITYKKEKTILKEINMNFKEGTITSIIGDNTSELLDIISLNKKMTEGNILIDNEKVNSKNIKSFKRKIGICPKHLKGDTVKEELEKIFNIYEVKNSSKRIKDTLKMVGLSTSYLDRKINTLSSGEVQKLRFAKVLVHNPKILIIENPTKNLDSKNRRQLIKLLRLIKLRYKKTIIIISKDTDMLLELSDYIYEIENGKINAQGDKYIILSNEKILKKCNLAMPKTIEFSELVKKKKNINIGYRDNLNDLMKDIYRFTEWRE